MSLQEKVLKLKLDGAIALRHAQFWEKQIAQHGEAKTTAFYKSLGLNHLDGNGPRVINDDKRIIELTIHRDSIPPHRKSAVEWEGLTLSREPTEVEKLCIKSIASAQEAGKASVTVVLLRLRTDLIDDALKAIKKLKPATYHELILKTPKESRAELREQLTKIFNKGRRLVAAELSKGKAIIDIDDDEDDEELDDLTDLTDSRVVNDVQSRITAAAARYALLGLAGAALWEAVNKEMADGSVSYIDRAATGITNKVLAFGRSREMDDRKDEIDHFEQSALLDPNTCEPCVSDDGKTSPNMDDLPGGPNPYCLGSDFCRCFVVAVAN